MAEAAALRTGNHVDLEHSFEQLGPAGICQTYLFINRFDPFLNRFNPFSYFSSLFQI